MRGGGVNNSHAAIVKRRPSNASHEIPRAAGPYPYSGAPANLVVPVYHLQILSFLRQRVVLNTGEAIEVGNGLGVVDRWCSLRNKWSQGSELKQLSYSTRSRGGKVRCVLKRPDENPTVTL